MQSTSEALMLETSSSLNSFQSAFLVLYLVCSVGLSTRSLSSPLISSWNPQ